MISWQFDSILNIEIEYRLKSNWVDFKITSRLIVKSSFDFNYWNRFDPTISTLEIDSKFESISIILKSIRFDSSRYSIPILEIESNCQETKNNVIMPRITNSRIRYFINKMQYL